MPPEIDNIVRSGYVNWASKTLPPEFRARFDAARIPVAGVRHVRLWGIQVDDERELPGRERTSIADDELWEIVLVAKDGSTYEVNSEFVVPAAD